jgi:SNF2 family DNA or RNA helicase
VHEVYTAFTAERAAGRLREAQCKCRVVILEADKVNSKKREHWIDKHVVKPGIEVLLVNPVAVQTGLNNLVHFCSVIWYENPGCNPQVRRQAQGRVYRIGQTKPVRNYTLYYENTAQSLLHELLLYKVGISEAVDGLDPKGSLQAAGVGEVSELSGQSVGAVLYKMLLKEMGE